MEQTASDLNNKPLLDPTLFSISDHGQSPRRRPVPAKFSAWDSALGQPEKKRLFAVTDIAAVSFSLVCFVLGVVTIVPDLSISWSLQYSGQIVVIGFILGIMTLCMRTVLPYAFVLLEARFGKSRLQNYEAILTGRAFSSTTSLGWRLALIIVVVIPLGLSVAYKRFLGGTSSAVVSLLNPEFGISFPRLGTWAPPADSVYLAISAMSAFLTAAQYDPQPYPTEDKFPVAYGYNTLLLSNTSAAVLDVPINTTLLDLQKRTHSGEVWNISATVDAYLAVQDLSSDFRTNNTTWSDYVEGSSLQTIFLYNGNRTRLGMLPCRNNSDFFYSIYAHADHFGGMISYSHLDDNDTGRFRRTANKYSLKRTTCTARWHVNATMMLLVSGECDVNSTANSSILHGENMGVVDFDALPFAQHYFHYMVPNTGSTQMDWLDAAYVMSVATMYWARALFMLDGGQSFTLSHYGGYYVPPDATFVSIRPTLNAKGLYGLLYLVLALQPLITLAALAVTVWLHRVPLGKGFGITSVLSGYEPGKSESIGCAGLSGKLRTPVTLHVYPTVPEQYDISPEVGSDEIAHIKYQLSDETKARERPRLQKGQVYW